MSCANFLFEKEQEKNKQARRVFCLMKKKRESPTSLFVYNFKEVNGIIFQKAHIEPLFKT